MLTPTHHLVKPIGYATFALRKICVSTNSRLFFRAVLAAAFLCHLIEDYADEWCTKMMYYFRWADPETARACVRWVIRDLRPELRGAERAAAESTFFQRQRDRREMVRCGPANGPLIEAHFGELLRGLSLLGGPDQYLFGTQPSLADFALYGQLFQLSLDAWPQTIVRCDAPLVENWVYRLDDASGVNGAWDTLTQPPAMLGEWRFCA
jgi:glutathione S-transferase